MAVQPGRRRRVTGADVAREAGVSAATVSYVLNNTPHQKIPETTRQRILDAAARLGYAPSAAARALSRGRSEVVLCLLPDWPIGPALGALLEHLTEALAEQGLTLLAYPHSRNARPTSELWRAIGPAAVVGFEDFTDQDSAAIKAAGIEVSLALFGRGNRRDLGVPQQRLGRLQGEHLAAAGHRRLGYAWPEDQRLARLARLRLDGVRQACADLGLQEPDVRTVPLDPEAASVAVRTWHATEPAVTGVCAFNDYAAMAILAAMCNLGLNAPDDLAVIGVDDMPAARLTTPPLTTVMTDQQAVAKYVAGAILAGLEGKSLPRRPGSDTVHLIRRRSA